MRQLKIRYINLIFILFFVSLLCLPASLASAQQPPQMDIGRHILYVGKLTQPSPVDALISELAAASPPIPTKAMFKGQGVSWQRDIDGAEVSVFSTKDLFWICIAIEQVEDVEPFLSDLLKTLAKQRGLPEPIDCQITDSISITIINPDGTIDMAGMQVANSPSPDFYRLVTKSEAAARYGVSESAVTMEVSENQVYWVVKTGDGNEKVTAMTYHRQAGGEGEEPKNTMRNPSPADFDLPPASPDPENPNHKDYVIMYKSSLSGWDSVISALHTKHTDYQDLTFTTNVSEKLSDLQTIKPDYVIIVIDPTDGDPDFFDDVDETMCAIDADEFEDTVWTVITGFDATDALALVNASNPTDDHTLIIANPDGSLSSAGGAGNYLASIISDDDTYLGTATHYVNTGSSSDSDSSASNMETEIENDNKDCVLFLDHGNTYGWVLRKDPINITLRDWFYAGRSTLETWENRTGTYYTVDNNQNTFAFAAACLTSRITDNRGTNWSPWESVSSNSSGDETTSIALAWIEDSPGFYASNDSVSYGTAHIKMVVLNMMKFGYTPAKAVMISKNVYHYIIGDETTEDDDTDGHVDDLLLYLEREFLGFGDTDWNITIAGSPPDYTITYTGHTQIDQEATNPGYVYVDNNIQWQCTTTLTFNEELAYEPWTAAYPDSPLTLIYVENVTGDGSTVSCDDACAVIAGIFKPTADTTSIDFVTTNPSDTSWYLYDHPWYGAGTTNSYEIFKCKKNTDELIWIVGAGLTDAEEPAGDDNLEWRINSGTSKSFNVYYWLPGVEQTVGTLTFVDQDTRQKAVNLHNQGSAAAANAIAKVPVPGYATNPSVSGATDETITTDAGKTYAEFTVASIGSDVTTELTLQYDLSTTVGSYSDLDPLTACDDFSDYGTEHTAYIYGTGFTASHEYRVAYYDGNGDKIATHDVDSDSSGNLSSQHTFVQGTDAAGTWYAIVCERTETPPSTYDSNWEYTLTDDTFHVDESAIPEFPTVLAAIVSLALCSGIYLWMRQKAAPVAA